MNRILSLVFASLFLLLPARAQFDFGAVLGNIKDAKGGVIANAAVTLRNLETGITATTTTDTGGDYIFPGVRIGRYSVRAELQGFSVALVDNVSVTVESRQRVDIIMQVGEVTQTVNITEDAPLLESDSSSKGQVISQKQIVNLPLIGRTYSSLALLVPGVRQSLVGNQGDIAFRREGSYNVNGLRSVYNNFLLDGIDNNFYGTTNQGFSNQAVQPSPDFVQEFRMTINSYSAEFGRSSGAVMNVTTRSGGNDYHGTVYHFLQNTSLNATGFFRPPLGVKPQVNRNQFGGVFGGRIVRDRTFFMLNYEGGRWIQSPFSLTSVPSDEQRLGLIPTAVRAPITYTASDGRTVAAGTVFNPGTPVPMTRLARYVMDNLPRANRPGGGAFGVANNFGGFVRNQLFDDKGDARLDHQFSTRLNFFARYSQRRQDVLQPGLIDGPAGGNAIGFLNVYNQQGAAGLTFSQNPTSVWEIRYAVTRLGMDRLPASVGGPSMRELFGITGLPEGSRIQGGVTPQDIAGFPRFGRQSTNPQAQFPTTNNARLNYNKLLGRHTLKTGYEFYALNVIVDDTNPLYGIDAYGGGFSNPTAPGGGLNFNLADFFAGARTGYQLATQVQAQVRQRGHWMYLQDDFRVNQKLTINLGIRYELTSPMYDANDRLANFDPVSNQLITASSGGWENRGLRANDFNNFAPRFGLAYKLGDRTVIRGGYGLGYNYWNRMASAEILSTNAPFVTRFSQVQTAGVIGNLCTGNNVAGCFRPTQAGYPVNPPANVILYMQRQMPWSYVQNWHLTVQRQLTKDNIIDLAYVGNRGSELPIMGDFNQARPLTSAELALPAAQRPSLQARRPIANFGNITSILPLGFSNYHGLQAKFEHRGREVSILSSFTYSKAIDNAGQVLETVVGAGGSNVQDIRNPNNDRGPSSFDQRFNSTTSFVYNTPFGRGRRFGSGMPAALDAILGGWGISGIVTLTSGLPINLRYPDTEGRVSDNQADFLGSPSLRPNVLRDPLVPSTNRAWDFYLDPAAVAIPTLDQPFGNAGRNLVYGFPLYQVDLSVQKSFKLPFNEVSRLEFRGEFFNLLNKTNFGPIDSNRASASFGRASSTFDPRNIQFALKLYF